MHFYYYLIFYEKGKRRYNSKRRFFKLQRITGTLILFYYICRREVWLMAHELHPNQENPFLEIGRLIHQESYSREKKEIVFNKRYYKSLMKEYGYNPLEFEKINFSLGKLSKEDLQRKLLKRVANGV